MAGAWLACRLACISITYETHVLLVDRTSASDAQPVFHYTIHMTASCLFPGGHCHLTGCSLSCMSFLFKRIQSATSNVPTGPRSEVLQGFSTSCGAAKQVIMHNAYCSGCVTALF